MSDPETETKAQSPPWSTGLPIWATQEISEFFDHHMALVLLLDLSRRGISTLQKSYDIAKFLANGRLEEEAETLRNAAEQSALAKSEVENDFPLLQEQGIVALWGSLESLVRSFAAAWLANAPGAWKSDALKKIRVRVGDYEALDPIDRCLWVIDLLDQETSGPLKAGLGRFESLLEPFQLNGPVSEYCRKSLFELSHVRHVIVHRRGKSDRRIINLCPWMQLKPGDKIKISYKMWVDYNEAVIRYVGQIIRRVRLALGLPEDWDKTQDSPKSETRKVVTEGVSA